MKMNKSIFALAFALAVGLASTGCQHHPNEGVTQIPGGNSLTGETGLGGTLPDDTGNLNNGQIAQAPLSNFDNTTEDRAALAADSIHFAYDSAAIRNSEQSKLQDVAKMLNSDQSLLLRIEGNCDERGTEEYNRSLGQRRADAARDALAKMGVDPMRIQTLSNGKDKPVDTGHDESAWKQNRRDDFILLRPKTGI